MKYQEGLKETKDFLKTTPEPQMRELCNKPPPFIERKKDELLQSLFSQVNRIDSK